MWSTSPVIACGRRRSFDRQVVVVNTNEDARLERQESDRTQRRFTSRLLVLVLVELLLVVRVAHGLARSDCEQTRTSELVLVLL